MNKFGDILLFNRDLVLKWDRAGWHRIAGPPLTDLLIGQIPLGVAERLASVVVQLSHQRQGALFVLCERPEQLATERSKGIAYRFAERQLFNFEDADPEIIVRLARIDGAVIINKQGAIIDAGVILQVPQEFAGDGKGARTAAAAFASTFGVAIKVSHDGPISFYRGGSEVRKVG